MPRLNNDFKESIKRIPLEELQKLLFKLSAANREIYDLIKVRYISNSYGQELFEETLKEVLSEIRSVGESGIIQKKLAKAMGKAIQHINRYVKINKDKVGEAKLLLQLLDEVFANYSQELGTCWTVFDSKLAITTKRFYNLVTTKLHRDYLIEYQQPLNRFLKTLHASCGHLDSVYGMPKEV